jgi:hypothetical protein
MKKLLIIASLIFVLFNGCGNDTTTETPTNNSNSNPTPHSLTGTWNEEGSLTDGYTEKFIFVGYYFVPNSTYTYINTKTSENYTGQFLFGGSSGTPVSLTNFNGNTIIVSYVFDTLNKVYMEFSDNEVKTFIREK